MIPVAIAAIAIRTSTAIKRPMPRSFRIGSTMGFMPLTPRLADAARSPRRQSPSPAGSGGGESGQFSFQLSVTNGLPYCPRYCWMASLLERIVRGFLMLENFELLLVTTDPSTEAIQQYLGQYGN